MLLWIGNAYSNGPRGVIEGAFVVGNVVGMGLGSSTDGVIVVDAFVGHCSATSAGMAGGSNVGCC